MPDEIGGEVGAIVAVPLYISVADVREWGSCHGQSQQQNEEERCRRARGPRGQHGHGSGDSTT